MSDDLTKRMSHNDRDNYKQQIQKRLDMLIGMVEILGADIQSVKADLQNVKIDLQKVKADLQDLRARTDVLEKMVDERLYDKRPLWERALAEIAELRSVTGEIRTEIGELRSEMREGFYNFGTKIELLLRDMFSLRTDHERLSRRVDDLTPKTT